MHIHIFCNIFFLVFFFFSQQTTIKLTTEKNRFVSNSLYSFFGNQHSNSQIYVSGNKKNHDIHQLELNIARTIFGRRCCCRCYLLLLMFAGLILNSSLCVARSLKTLVHTLVSIHAQTNNCAPRFLCNQIINRTKNCDQFIFIKMLFWSNKY